MPLDKTRKLALLLASAFAILALTACGGADDTKDGGSSESGSSGGGSGKTISLVAYSTPQVVYDEIIPAFKQTPEGKGVDFKTSYGASGDQSRAVEGGLKADYVSFSTEGDMTRLVEAGLVADDWKSTPSKGRVNTSVVAFVVREGNPKNIKTWADLVKPGVQVLTPNPFSSGAAKWNLLAALGANDLDYVKTLINDHVKVQDKSGREALQNFLSGSGDVLLSYEYEAITAKKKGEKVDYVLPDDTIQIDIDVATTKDAPAEAQKFQDYVLSEEGQKVFADWGYRPVNQTVLDANKDKFPTPKGLFTIDKFGGWAKADEELFDPENGTIAKIEEDAGVSTAK